MARELNMDFNIVWGKLEEINTHIVGNMVININEEDKKIVTDYIKNHDIIWEVL
jgi:D-methionine transport system ATP-binding protein